jgi:hypothetical protein
MKGVVLGAGIELVLQRAARAWFLGSSWVVLAEDEGWRELELLT